MRNIPLRQVRAVIAVCEEGSFTRAAEPDQRAGCREGQAVIGERGAALFEVNACRERD